MGIRCPKCGAEMRRRTAKRERYRGREFWGCTGYPACNGTVGANVERLIAPSRASKWRKIRMFDIGVFLIVSIGMSVWYKGVPSLTGISKVESTGPGDTISGRASVIDGDTIEIHGQRIRFNGIDAPETDQKCSREKWDDYLSFDCTAP